MRHAAQAWAAVVLLSLSLALVGALSACAPMPAGTGSGARATPTGLSTNAVQEADETAIYAAVIRRIYTRDDTFGGQLQPPSVYLVRNTDDGIGDPGIPVEEPRAISQAVQEGVVAALADLPATVAWVDARDDVALNPSTGELADGGVIITLGNIHYQEDGSALVSASVYIASLAAGGQTYVLQQVDGAWEVTGNTGVEWIS